MARSLNKKFAVIAACIIGAAVILLAILLPLSCRGDKPASAKHVCHNVCETCGKCTDVNCDAPECAVKCGEGKTTYTFEAENAALAGGGMGRLTVVGEGTPRVAVGNLNTNKGASVTFFLAAEQDMTASLVVTVTRRAKETKFTDVIGVSVNGGEDLRRSAVVPAVSEDDEFKAVSYARYGLGCIALQAGDNTLTFTIRGDGEYSGYDFDKIELLGAAAVTARHGCTTLCPECEKCSDADCTDEHCKNKCACAVTFEAENAERSNGGSPMYGYLDTETNADGRTYVKNFVGNKGATLTYRFFVEGSDNKAYKVRLYATVTRHAMATVFTDTLDVTVNNASPLKTDAVISAFGGTQWSEDSFAEFYIGEILLITGENTVSFTVRDNGDYGGYNFDKITLRKAPVIHDCEHACKVCGGCTSDCAEKGCAVKCECKDIKQNVVIEAENVDRVQYADGENPDANGGVREEQHGNATVVGGFNNNKGAWIEFTYTSDGMRDALLFVTVNRRQHASIFSNWAKTTVTFADGGSQTLTSKARLDGYPYIDEEDNQWGEKALTEIYLGRVRLHHGDNKIRFTVLGFDPVTELGGYNYDKLRIGLLGDPAQKYALTFNKDGGTGNVTGVAASYPETAPVILPSGDGIDKDGYMFVGWKYDGITYAAGDRFVMPADAVTFTAVWTKIAVFEAENAALVNGASDPNYPIGVEDVLIEDGVPSGRKAVRNLSNNKGATITFTFEVSGDASAPYENIALVITSSRFEQAHRFTEFFQITVNGVPMESDAEVSAYSGAIWWDESYTDTVLGTVSLQEGTNTIVLTVAEDCQVYNIDKLTLRDLPEDLQIS